MYQSSATWSIGIFVQTEPVTSKKYLYALSNLWEKSYRGWGLPGMKSGWMEGKRSRLDRAGGFHVADAGIR